MDIKSFIGLAVTSVVVLGACQSDSFQVKGFAPDLNEGDTICLALENNHEKEFAQVVIADGKFSFSGQASSAVFCKAYLKQKPSCFTTFILEPGTITLELKQPIETSRVSGTELNNKWQLLNDSCQLLGKQLLKLSEQAPATDSLSHAIRLKTIDSLHKMISSCILNAAHNNKKNVLERYIEGNYKEPEFK